MIIKVCFVKEKNSLGERFTRAQLSIAVVDDSVAA